LGREIESMMGPRQVDQAPLFYEFSLERHVPAAHLLRAIDRFVDLSDVCSHLAPFYGSTGRPSIDPELLVRMLLVGYCYGIRSERRLCEEVHLNLACTRKDRAIRSRCIRAPAKGAKNLGEPSAEW
jgi:transposase